ncbi:alpha/beta hydrolase [Conexibacter sp. DBS9H8]|uniref:alpha/beta hydrolase n=1 Tax=Conexibacter sp. DBS9H8 TaxID=2937801 RepID=UPI002010669C|nr:alpha/beta hydrolase [Conexibacter sp. DBS9H8]
MPEFTLTSAAGPPLAVTVWETPDSPRAIVILAHGWGEHVGRYSHVAARLTGAGFLVVGPDHHGHGRSGGPRGQIRFADAVADLNAVIDSQVAIHPDLPVFLLGHSMGGAIALRYALAHQERLRGLVLSGPLVRADAPGMVKLVGTVLAHLLPWAPVVRLDPSLISRDARVVEAYRADPLVRHLPIPALTGREFLTHAATILTDAPRIRVPTMLLWGGADGLCPPAGSEALAATLGAEDLTCERFDGLYHEIFLEPEGDLVLDMVVAWLADRL